jgi:hypothetical protein
MNLSARALILLPVFVSPLTAQRVKAPAQNLSASSPFAYQLTPILVPRPVAEGTEPVFDYLSINDSGEVAFVARWRDTEGKFHEGLYTTKRVVVEVGDKLDGRSIVKVNSAQINNEGKVAYEAQFSPQGADPSSNMASGQGNFIEKTLILSNESVPQQNIGGITGGTDGEFYIMRGDGSVTSDGKTWIQPNGPIPAGFKERQDAGKILNPPKAYALRFPWQPGQKACGPILGLGMISGLIPRQNVRLNTKGEPVLTYIGQPGDNLSMWTPAGEVVGQDRSMAAKYDEFPVWVSANLPLSNAFPIPGQNRQDPQMNRRGQIAFTANPIRSDKRPFGAVIATPIKSQGCAFPPS